jgi:predicted Zn finger-like uncharacterized protein
MIEIQCTSCHTRYRIDERVLPDDTPTFKCSRCGHVFNASPIPAKSRRPVAQSQTAETQADRRVRPPRPRASALKPPAESSVVADDALENELVERDRVAGEAAVESESQSASAAPPAAREPQLDSRAAFERTIPGSDRRIPESTAEEFVEGTASESSHPLDRVFADREQEADTGENLKFDFSDDATRGGAAEHEPEMLRADNADDRWEVGATPPEFESAPAPRTLTVADAADTLRAAPTHPHRSVPPFKSTPPQFAEPPAQAKSAGYELGYLDGDDDASLDARGNTHASGFFLGMFFIVALGFLAASFLICDEPLASARLLSQTPRIGGYFARPIVPAMLVALHDVQPEYRTLKGDQPALVIGGSAQNVGTRKLHLVQIAVDLLGAGGRSLARQSVFCGNELSAKMLGEMTPREIEFSQGLSPQRSFAMEPSGAAPFLMVFINPPAEARQIRITVTQAVAAESADAATPAAPRS